MFINDLEGLSKVDQWNIACSYFRSICDLLLQNIQMNGTVIILQKSMSRSSRPDVFCKKGVLRNFAKFTGKEETTSW